MKDPAFLFYPSDFLTGTMLMTDEQVGKYIRLLCYQHQTGHLSEEDMLKICKTHDEHIFSKFIKCDDGKYHNIRLHNEILKRKAYSESRRKNRMNKKDMINISSTHDEHMENEDINGNKNIISKCKCKNNYAYVTEDEYNQNPKEFEGFERFFVQAECKNYYRKRLTHDKA